MEYEVNDIPAPAEPEPKDPDMASMARWVIGLFFAFLAATIGLTALQHAVQPSENDEARAAAAQFSAPPGLVSSFTKSQFNAEVQGKTKDQVRAEFGKPGLVRGLRIFFVSCTRASVPRG
jgi:hypothetical protein